MKTITNVKVNLTPTGKQIDAILDMQTFVDQLILIGNENPKTSILGADFNYWNWAIVSIDNEFQFPVPIRGGEKNKMSLFNNGTSFEFCLEHTAVILAIYYFSHYDILKSSKLLGRDLGPMINFALTQASLWENRMGGSEKCLQNYHSLREFLSTDEDLYAQVCEILN